MATLALGAVGSAIGGPVGGFIGAAVGGLIDNLLLFPALFPPPNQQGARLSDIQLQQATDGTPLPWCIGPKTRVPGILIWIPRKADGRVDFKETSTTTEQGKGGSAGSVTTYSYFVSLAVMLCEGPVNRVVRIWADSKLIYDNGRPLEGKYEDIAVYTGNQTTPDPLIEAYRGVGNTPAYKKRVYVRITNLAISAYGNRIPNITAEIQAQSAMTTAEAVTAVMGRYGYAPEQYDVSRLRKCFKGGNFPGRTTGEAILQTLCGTYGIGVRQDADKLTFFERGKEDVIRVTNAQLAYYATGERSETPYETIDESNIEIPFRADVRFTDPDNALQIGTATRRRQGASSLNTIVFDATRLTLDRSEAEKIASQILWLPELSRKKYKGSLAPSMRHVQEGDVLLFDNGLQCFVTQLDYGANGLIEFQGVKHEPQLFNQVGQSTASQQDVNNYADTFKLLDLPALQPTQLESFGVGTAYALKNTLDPYTSPSLLKNTTAENYSTVGLHPRESVYGLTESVLRTDIGFEAWDDTSELLVRLFNGSLVSASQESILANGENLAAVQTSTGAWEVLHFRTAELVEDNLWRLTGFLRARRGTETAAQSHVSTGHSFALLTVDSIGVVPFALTNVGTTVRAKAVQPGEAATSVDSVSAMFTGRTRVPFSVVDLRAVYDSSNNLVVTWSRRSKRFFNEFEVEAPLTPDEVPEAYVLEFFISRTLPARRTVVASSQNYTYTNSEISSDGWGVARPQMYVVVRQLTNENLRSDETVLYVRNP